MQRFRLLGRVVNRDNFNAVADRLTSQWMIQIDPDFIFIVLQDRAGQCLSIPGSEFDY